MRRILQGNQFRRDYKRQEKRGKDMEKLEVAVALLVRNGTLPSSYRPHRFGGEWKGWWECHIAPDWLLIYDINEEELLLARTGTHADLLE